MTWIKTEDLMPPTHEIIVFQDRWRNEHYGVLCSDFSDASKRNKFWCHVSQQSYEPEEIVYWTEIPINQHMLRERYDFGVKVNEFLWETIKKIEDSILEDFKKQLEEHPEWNAENFVSIAVRNSSWRIMNAIKVTKDDR